MISSTNLSELPSPTELRKLTRALAALDAILSPEWEYRYYSFDSRWGDGELMASMRNGLGDGWFALFTESDAALQGCWHESPLLNGGVAPQWVLERVPPLFFENFVGEPAFASETSTFCLWWTSGAPQWRSSAESHPTGPAHDGSSYLLFNLSGRPQDYVEFSRSYYEVQIAERDVASVYAHADIDEPLLRRLGFEGDSEQLARDLEEIGYRGSLRL